VDETKFWLNVLLILSHKTIWVDLNGKTNGNQALNCDNVATLINEWQDMRRFSMNLANGRDIWNSGYFLTYYLYTGRLNLRVMNVWINHLVVEYNVQNIID
jgi:hypothetical protein